MDNSYNNVIFNYLGPTAETCKRRRRNTLQITLFNKVFKLGVNRRLRTRKCLIRRCLI